MALFSLSYCVWYSFGFLSLSLSLPRSRSPSLLSLSLSLSLAFSLSLSRSLSLSLSRSLSLSLSLWRVVGVCPIILSAPGHLCMRPVLGRGSHYAYYYRHHEGNNKQPAPPCSIFLSETHSERKAIKVFCKNLTYLDFFAPKSNVCSYVVKFLALEEMEVVFFGEAFSFIAHCPLC